MIENWRPIKGYEDYEISDLGRVRSKGRYRNIRGGGKRFIPAQVMRVATNEKRGGYQNVKLCKNGKHTTFAIHRLVAEAFIDNPHKKPQVNHINNMPSDNRAVNLEWVTAKENAEWKVICGRSESKIKKPVKAIEIATGNSITFESTLAATRLGFSRPSIWRCMTGEYSHHHGYRFEFVDT